MSRALNITMAILLGAAVTSIGALVYKISKINKLEPKKTSIERIWCGEADTNNDGVLTLEEKAKAWQPMGWRMEQQLSGEYELIQPGKPEQIYEGLQWEIDHYEQDLQENGYEFYYDTESKEYIVTKKPESLRK